MHLMLQTENEAAMQQIKRLRLEHAHSLQHLTEENARLQRTLAHIQVKSLACKANSLECLDDDRLLQDLHSLANFHFTVNICEGSEEVMPSVLLPCVLRMLQ